MGKARAEGTHTTSKRSQPLTYTKLIVRCGMRSAVITGSVIDRKGIRAWNGRARARVSHHEPPAPRTEPVRHSPTAFETPASTM